ncbi:hypothetical protein JKP88DRAFT_250306 [Tribonema minus]|uniref:Uncharacterized protein n=1 Tax=Tribonema minus TaxID=303371 RepID=A0A835YGS8_9STRA|nr:hypothetical protein JKP88DRAFT_250306 [Tribonema minus]
MAPYANRRQTSLTDLSDQALENIFACVSLRTLGLLVSCGSITLAPFCERSPHRALGVAALNAANKSADDDDKPRLIALIPAMDALRALDPRTSAAFQSLAPRRQLIALVRFTSACVANLAAVVRRHMTGPSRELWNGFPSFAAWAASNNEGGFWATSSPQCRALTALEATDPQAVRRMRDLMVLNVAREELAHGPRDFAAAFAGLPPAEWGDKLAVHDSVHNQARAASSADELEVRHWDGFYLRCTLRYMKSRFAWGSSRHLSPEYRGMIIGDDRHTKRRNRAARCAA